MTVGRIPVYLAATLVALFFAVPADAQKRATTRISVASSGLQGNERSRDHSISANGRYVAFESYASNLVSDDTNGTYDVFVHDRQTAQTTRVSVASSGNQGNSSSWYPSISADGRHVAFGSWASNLVPGDTNGTSDIYVHDRHTARTTRVSVSSSGLEGNSGSYYPSISADGRHVAFHSAASNLVAGDTNGYWDVFMHARGHPTGIANQGGDKQKPKVSIFGAPTVVNAPQTGNSTIYVNTKRPHLGLAGVTRARIRERLFERPTTKSCQTDMERKWSIADESCNSWGVYRAWTAPKVCKSRVNRR